MINRNALGYGKTFILMAGMTALFAGGGYLTGGGVGMGIALAMAGGMNFFAYFFSDKLALKRYQAEPITREKYPKLFVMIEGLARNAKMPMPKPYIINSDQPNAFATGRNPKHAAVAMTSGILQLLDERELRGVMAHELAHIKNRDTLIMTITATIAGAISSFARFGMMFRGRGTKQRGGVGGIGVMLMMVLAPLAAMLVQMTISRTREYAADKQGALIANDPLGLASALNKISGAARHMVNHYAERNPASAHMFIINPLKLQSVDNFFSTHPKAENRIQKLEELAKAMHITDNAYDDAKRGRKPEHAYPKKNPFLRGQFYSRDARKTHSYRRKRNPWR